MVSSAKRLMLLGYKGFTIWFLDDFNGFPEVMRLILCVKVFGAWLNLRTS